MLQKNLFRSLAIALAASLAIATSVACDPPQEADDPVSEQAQNDDEAALQEAEPRQEQHAQLEAPEEMAIDGPEGDPFGSAPPQLEGEVSDEDLDNFADAIAALSGMEDAAMEAQQRAMQADSPEEQFEIIQEIDQLARESLDGTGVDLEDLDGFIHRIQVDEELQQRVDEHDDIDLRQLMGPAEPQQQPPGGGQAPPMEPPQ